MARNDTLDDLWASLWRELPPKSRWIVDVLMEDQRKRLALHEDYAKKLSAVVKALALNQGIDEASAKMEAAYHRLAAAEKIGV